MADRQDAVPQHIGIIMDGNRRWAKKRGLPGKAGYVQGAKVFENITRHCEKIGVKALTVYAFSTENWSRPKDEVSALMKLLRSYLKDAFNYKEDNIKITFIGDRTRLGKDLQKLMDEIEDVSGSKTGLLLNIAINYGGRDEIVRAARLLAQDVADGTLRPEQIDEAFLESRMYTAGQPPLDLVLRPSGEQRISNFMLWQCAYSEFVYMDVLWPDFTPEMLDRAVEEYAARSRRFGGA